MHRKTGRFGISTEGAHTHKDSYYTLSPMQICRGRGEASVRLCWKVQGILGTAQYQMSPVEALLGVSVEKSWLMGQQRSKDSTQTL